MKKVLFILIASIGFTSYAQNSIGVRAGFQAGNSTVKTFDNLNGTALDSVSISQEYSSFSFALDFDIELGKGLYLTQSIQWGQKGFENISYESQTGLSQTLTGIRDYVGYSPQIKYVYGSEEKALKYYAAVGPRFDFTIGDPSPAELASGNGSAFIRTVGTTKTTAISIQARGGVSIDKGPGSILVELNYVGGISDFISDVNISGMESAIGASLGYKINL